MKTKYTKHMLCILFLALSFTSCNEVLNETPDNRTQIDTPEKIGELLVAAYPGAGYVSFTEPMSDNAGDKGPSAADYPVNTNSYYWRDIVLEDSDTPPNYWDNTYKAISQANQALQSIADQGNKKALDKYRGEALLCRAYAHFMLVNMFSKAYNTSTAGTDLGIPYVSKPETVLLEQYTRGTVKEVYDKIQADLEAGLPLIQDNYQVKAFHFTKKAAAAFASRFYLTIGDWNNVVKYSTIALGGTGEGQLRNWDKNYRTKSYTEQTILFSSSLYEPANLLLVSAYSLYGRFHYSARYQLNEQKLNDIFPPSNATGGRWAYGIFGSGGLFNNVPKYNEYFKVTNEAAGIGYPYLTYVLLSTDEAILNRAEAYAMLGQYDKALADINLSYSVKTRDYDPANNTLTDEDIRAKFAVTNTDLYTPFYTIPADALPYVNAVIVTKRTIFYNEGLRWFDIKRMNMEVLHTDINQNEFKLPKSDNRRALQIPQSATAFGIEENPR